MLADKSKIKTHRVEYFCFWFLPGCFSHSVTERLGLASPGGSVRHKFCSSHCWFSPTPLQSFGELVHKPLLVDLTVEEGQRLKVIYGSCAGFHAVDVDSGSVYDIYLPTHVRKNPHSMVGWLASLCFDFSLCSAQGTNTGRGPSLPFAVGVSISVTCPLQQLSAPVSEALPRRA